MNPFRLHPDADGPATPLQRGVTVLEASAGTGKTFAIAGVVARLVLEAGIPLERIAVLTFTEAATAELRDRVRGRIAELERAADGGPADPFAAALVAAASALPAAERTQWRKRLRQAAATVDLARISTLHGFARRTGTEHAAALGLDAGAEPTTDLRPWRTRTVHDWIRRHLRAADPALVGLLAADPAAQLLALAERAERAPLAALATPAIAPAAAAAEVARLAAAWPGLRRRLEAVLADRAGDISGSSIFPPKRCAPRIETLIALFAGAPVEAKELATAAEMALPEKLAKAVLKGRQPLDPAPFHDLGRLLAERAALAPALLAGFIADYRAALAERPRQPGSGHVDDPLRALHAGLARDPALAARIGAGLDAVLVDESQDTDQRQWEILHACFGGGGHHLVLIGDPKQAIYRFRCTDVHVFLAARDRAPAGRRFTLATNHRSDAGLVAALGRLYRGEGAVPPVALPFALAGVDAPPVAARHGARLDPGTLAPEPLQLLHLDPTLAAGGEAAVLAVAAAVADEAVRLLDPASRVRLRDGEAWRPLGPRDLAVLVRTHRQGDRVARALARRGIPCVRCDPAPVFAADIARELAAVLAASLEPQREEALRAAAATRLVGAPASALAGDDPRLAALPRHLAELGGELRERGIAAWWYRLQDRDLGWGTPRLRLSARADAERLLADLHHLVELAAAAQADGALPADAVARWLRMRIADGADADGEIEQRRLERDDDAVRIVTVFAAKGLQYPVVFEAFAWCPVREEDDAGLLVHGADDVLEWHLAADADTAVRAADEALGDDLRKLYVGLTRAEHRCYAVWAEQPAKGAARGCRLSPLGLLLHGRGLGEGSGLLERLGAAVDAGGDLAWLAGLGIGLRRLTALPPPARWRQPPELRRAQPDLPVLPAVEVRRSWQRSSFTALARRLEAAEARDHDAFAVPAAADDGLGAGAAFGTAVHELYEHGDWAGWAEDPTDLARQLAGAIDAPAPAATAFAARMRATVALPVPGIAAALAGLPAAAVAREWPVRLPVGAAGELGAVFRGRMPRAAHWEPRLAGLRLPGGVFEGVIDAVVHAAGRWHVVDWKTNRLADYGEAALWEAMAAHDYLLQANLYLVAVHRWLRLRLGASSYRISDHLGAAAYAFVRGADPAVPGAGWCVLPPDPALIEDLDARFA